MILSMLYVIIGLVFLFIVAEISSLVFKIHNEKYYAIFHLAGGVLIYLLFLNLFKNRLLSLGAVLIIGILWEIHEWLLWKYVFKDRLHKPGGKDTKNDLIMDMLGALLFYVIEIF